LQGFPTAHRSLPYSSLPIHLPVLRSSSKQKQASNCFRQLQSLARKTLYVNTKLLNG
jgi:hypothetical protein